MSVESRLEEMLKMVEELRHTAAAAVNEKTEAISLMQVAIEEAKTYKGHIEKLQNALVEAGAMQRGLEQCLASPFPAEDMAIAQIGGGTSWIERSIMLRGKTHKLLLAETGYKPPPETKT